MDHICQVEGILSFTLAAIEAEIKTMHLLQDANHRKTAAEYTIRQITSLFIVIDDIEEELIDEIVQISEKKLESSASRLKFLNMLKQKLPQVSALQAMSQIEETRHRNYTVELIDYESGSTQDAVRRLENMKERAESLLVFAEQL